MRHLTAGVVLFGVIFGTHYDQEAVNPNKDANGLYQGGLGPGTSELAWSTWGDYNGYRPFLPMSAGIELGDSCGQVICEVKKDDGTVVYNAKVSSFFGWKHFNGGYLWRHMDDEQVQCNADASVTHLMAPSIYGTWTIGSAAGMTAYSSIAKGEGYITRLSLHNFENFATQTGGSESTYWTSYIWNTSGATSGFRVCLRGALAYVGGQCGSSALNVRDDVSLANVDCGAALCEAASEWPLEPEYYAAA